MKTNVLSTSLEAYDAIKSDGTLGRRQQEVLDAVAPGRDFSLQEIAKATSLGVNVVSGRCFELRELGLLEFGPTRPCDITHRSVHPVRRVAPAAEQEALFS
jgi:hypothetical protein